MDQEKFILESSNKFKDIFSYQSLNYTTNYNQVQLTCNKHSNTFSISARYHLKTDFGGCESCKIDIKFNELQRQSNEKFNNNFLIDRNTFIDTQSTMCKIKCIKHNYEFEVLLCNHFRNKTGCCDKCSSKTADNLKQKLIENSNLKFNSENRDEENLPRILFDFSQFNYTSYKEKGKILCVKHNNLFEITPTLHLRYNYGGCESCTPKYYPTKKEKRNEIKLNIKLEKDEEFKILDLPNNNNLYKVSNYGKIFSIRLNDYMKTYENKNGYTLIFLRDSVGESKKYKIHRLVAYLFVENNDNKEFVDHIDGVRNNNYYKNLRYVNRSENSLNSYKNTIYSIENQNIIKINNENTKEIINNSNYKIIGTINNKDFSNYKINEYGNTINVNTNKTLKYLINDGYATISLMDTIKNIQCTLKVHRLVAYTFLERPENFTDDLVVNHIDNNRLNNYYKNLEWCTSAENTTKHYTKRILQLDIDTEEVINEYKTFHEAYEKLGKVYGSAISKSCNGTGYKTVFGYKWKLIQ
uniref:HNH nuclease domain-containing protein n=1 Tax=viral metagenome TaxID=1070528 RepID=A0A6C0EHG1_9ZZZZ